MPYRIPRMSMCDYYMNDEYSYPDLVKDSDFPIDIKNNCPFKAVSLNMKS